MIFRLNNHYGLTLTELIVSSILIGIVMAGVAAFSVTVKDMENSSNHASTLSMRASGAMASLKKDASLATGNSENLGILAFDGTAPERALCFRHDIWGSPQDFTDDEWRCYFTNSANILRQCRYTASTPTGYGNAVCNNGLELLTLTDSDDSICPNSWYCFDPDTFYDTQFDTLNAIIFSLFAKNSTDAEDPLKNPMIYLTTQAAPTGHTFSQ